jgi:hypothetical protein
MIIKFGKELINTDNVFRIVHVDSKLIVQGNSERESILCFKNEDSAKFILGRIYWSVEQHYSVMDCDESLEKRVGQ